MNREEKHEEEIQDFLAWKADLDSDEEEDIEGIPDHLDLLPNFCQKWTVAQLWSAIREN